MSKKYKMPKLLANNWCSLWKNHTVYEKMRRDGEINALMSGGSIVHINIDASVTSSQAKTLIKDAVKNKMAHFALNSVYVECKDCGHVHKGNVNACPECASERIDRFSRVIGYFSKVSSWNKTRREHDFPKRTFASGEDLKNQLGE